MPVTTYTLAGDFNAIIGEVPKIIVTVHTNSDDGGWVNETDLKIALGGARIPVAADGTFSVTLPTSTGTGLQYEVRAVFTDPALRSKESWRSGWFPLTANSNLAERALNSTLRVTNSAAFQLAARIDGYVDHGNVSGVLTINPATATHVLDATGALLITLDAAADGTVLTLLVVSGASNVTVDGVDGDLTDGSFATFVRIRGAWVLAASGGTAGPADATPPTAVTGLTATGGSGQVSASWSAATDAESSVSYRWRVWLTSGGASGTWTTTTSTSLLKTSLTTAGSYTVEVYAYSGGGASATATATATVTVNPYPGSNAYDTFTRADGLLWGSTTEAGGLTWSSTGVGALIGSTSDMGVVSGKATTNGGTGAATVNLGATTASIAADYTIPSTGRASVMVGGSADGTNSVMARVFSNGDLKVFRPASGGTQIGSTVTGVALAGRIVLSYDATTGAITVTIDGVTKFTGSYVGLTGTRSGLEVTIDSTFDNVAWSW